MQTFCVFILYYICGWLIMNRAERCILVLLYLLENRSINYDIFCNNYGVVSLRTFQYILSDIRFALSEYYHYSDIKFNKDKNTYVIEY